MAKKRRKGEKEEEYEFIPPEFDEKSFLLKDIEGTKTQLFSAALAVVFGIIAFALSIISPLLGLVALVGGIVFMQYSYGLIKVNKDDIDKKTKIGNVALFFLLFLGVWILLLNPPFS